MLNQVLETLRREDMTRQDETDGEHTNIEVFFPADIIILAGGSGAAQEELRRGDVRERERVGAANSGCGCGRGRGRAAAGISSALDLAPSRTRTRARRRGIQSRYVVQHGFMPHGFRADSALRLLTDPWMHSVAISGIIDLSLDLND